MRLILQNVSVAENFGTPLHDCDYEETIGLLAEKQGNAPGIRAWAVAHLDAAIRSGAYVTKLELPKSKRALED